MADDEIHNTTVRTVLGSSRREHRWDLAHEVDITTVLGKSFFDLRLARPMGEDDVAISISCFLGSVELLVPVGTRVTLEGSTFLAGASSDVSGEQDVPPGDDDGVDLAGKQLPRLDIAATAVLGRVRVRTPDRPDRVKPRRDARFRRKKPTASPPPRRALADILAKADEEERLLTVAASSSAPSALAPEPVSRPAPAPTHLAHTPVDTNIAVSRNDFVAPVDQVSSPSADHPASLPVDAEIERTESVAGPVDMTFTRSEPEGIFDDFDPADFPDDAPVAS